MKNSLSEIQDLIIKFREDRDWQQFHKIKDLLIGLNIEVSELQELFLWKSELEIENINKDKIENEIADIFIFLTYITKEFDIDLLNAVKRKINLNNQKYPVEKSKGSNKKYTELE
jgi:NTP pyrophosphatase (non-canonical NTP hydrolase)